MVKSFELILDEDDDGVYAISLVDRPAIQENWIALSESHKIEFKEIDFKENILLGAVLIPDLEIDRIDDKTKEIFKVHFSGETIKKIAKKFMKQGYQSESTLQHKTKVQGVHVFETWVKEDMIHDKSVKYGFDYPLNTWLVKISVDNEEIKEKVKSGEIKGFSIEGFFNQKTEDQKLFDQLKELLTN